MFRCRGHRPIKVEFATYERVPMHSIPSQADDESGEDLVVACAQVDVVRSNRGLVLFRVAYWFPLMTPKFQYSQTI